MGYIKHHAIVVTSWDDKTIEKAWNMAKRIGCQVSEILGPHSNGYCSFLIPPDGSKEGWDRSYEGDEARAIFKAWTNAQRYDDGSSSLEWVEVSYGSDDGKAEITDHAWHTNEHREAL
jgi:hypothetical protein